MNLHDVSIRIRERSIVEIYDLSLLLCRLHWRSLALLSAASIVPWCVLDVFFVTEAFTNMQALTGAAEHPLLLGAATENILHNDAIHGTDIYGEHYQPAPTMLLYFLLCIQIPIMTAPLTLFLGNVLFRGNTSVRYCLRTAWISGFALLLHGLRKPLLFFTPAHHCEVLMLEQLSGKRARVRSRRLMSAWLGDCMGQLCMNVVIAALSMATLAVCVQAAVDIFISARNPSLHFISYAELCWEMISLQAGVLSYLAIIPLLVFFTTVRFVSYINLRTVREGWATELQLKDAAVQQFASETGTHAATDAGRHP